MQHFIVVCEGQTEERFVKSVLAPSLVHSGIILEPQTIRTSSSQKGGALSYSRVRKHIQVLLKSRPNVFVTTFFDLYGLDNSFPGFQIASQIQDVEGRVAFLNRSFKEDLHANLVFQPGKFIPHIQPYEFEALLFSDVEAMVSLFSDWQQSRSTLSAALREASGSPEHINQRPGHNPSSILQESLANPKYRKKLHGTQISKRIGLVRIEERCPIFSGWLKALRNMGAG